MNYFAYTPNKNGKYVCGSSGKMFIELKTNRGAIKRAIKYMGKNIRVFRYYHFYDNSTFTQIYGTPDNKQLP